MENKNEKKILYYDLEVIDSAIWKLVHRPNFINLLSFSYSELSKARKYIEENTLGIYVIRGMDGDPTIYVGQTTNARDRFVDHHRIKKILANTDNEDLNIYLFTFPNNDVNSDSLKYIERLLIEKSKSSWFESKNGNNGEKLEIQLKDKDYCDQIFPKIIELLKVFKLDLSYSKSEDDDSVVQIEFDIDDGIEKDHIFGAEKNGKYNFKIVKRDETWILLKNSKVNSKHGYENCNGKPNFPAKHFYEKFNDQVDENGILKTNIAWKSPTAPVCFALGNGSGSGWTKVWNEKGQTPDQVFRQSTDAE